MTMKDGTTRTTTFDPIGARRRLDGAPGSPYYYSLNSLDEQGIADVSRLPITVKIFVENLLRHAGSDPSTVNDAVALANWQPRADEPRPVGFWPARVLLQDFT